MADTDPNEARSPATVARRYIWYVTVASVSGLASGIPVAGAGGRLGMRLLAATAGDAAQGRMTEADEVVGRITIGGVFWLDARSQGRPGYEKNRRRSWSCRAISDPLIPREAASGTRWKIGHGYCQGVSQLVGASPLGEMDEAEEAVPTFHQRDAS